MDANKCKLLCRCSAGGIVEFFDIKLVKQSAVETASTIRKTRSPEMLVAVALNSARFCLAYGLPNSAIGILMTALARIEKIDTRRALTWGNRAKRFRDIVNKDSALFLAHEIDEIYHALCLDEMAVTEDAVAFNYRCLFDDFLEE